MNHAAVEQIVARMVGEDFVMPEQWHGRLATRRSGELGLLSAMLDDAWRKLRAETEAGREAMRWFESPRTSFGSFLFVCEFLGLEPERLLSAAADKFQGRLRLAPGIQRRRGYRGRIRIG